VLAGKQRDPFDARAVGTRHRMHLPCGAAKQLPGRA
jgi:hypothetical protein